MRTLTREEYATEFGETSLTWSEPWICPFRDGEDVPHAADRLFVSSTLHTPVCAVHVGRAATIVVDEEPTKAWETIVAVAEEGSCCCDDDETQPEDETTGLRCTLTAIDAYEGNEPGDTVLRARAM